MAAFEDAFTVGVDTLLTAHTPDIGTAWTLVSGNNTAFDIEESDDTLRVQNSTLTFVMSDDLGDADCYVEGELASLTTMPGKYVALRIQDADNFIGWVNAGTGGGGMRLVKVIAGSITNLMTMQGVSGRVYKIEAEGATIRFYEDSIQQGSDIAVTEFQTETRQGVIATGSSSRFLMWIGSYAADTLGGGGVTVTPSTINSESVSNNPSIQFGSVLNISPATIDSASTSNDPILSFSAVLNITPQAIDSVSAANDPSILFNSALNLTPSTINSLSVSNNPVIEFKSVINVLPQTIDSLSASKNPFISFGVVQTIGNVTASFKDSGISVKYEEDEINVGYKPNAITVNFK
ncbi:MAG TPA: hypothetical protein EYN67_19005 [Flavobacteriales bacterium]|nr:hypothetical protein [Methylococcaceae bacterium]HHZ97576.1 hypothetical protein [Flavobacteriales bacterium]